MLYCCLTIAHTLLFALIFCTHCYNPFVLTKPSPCPFPCRPIPILEAADDGAEDPEVELGPLLMQPDLILVAPAKMIVLRNPDKAVSVGVSATAASMVGRSDPHHRTNEGKSAGSCEQFYLYSVDALLGDWDIIHHFSLFFFASSDGMQRRRQGPGAMDIERERDARPVPWEQRVLDAGERFLDRIGALGRDEPIPARPQDRPARRREGGDREGGRVHHEVGHMPGRNAQNDQPEEHDQFIVEEPRRARYWPF